MKSYPKVVAILLALSGVTIHPSIEADTVRITNGEWPPYLSENLAHYGVASRIVTEAFAHEGIEVEYGFFPWNRAFRIAKVGQWDGTAIWTFSEERDQFFYYSEPVLDSGYVFFHRKSFSFDWQGVEDLEGLRIGATRGYNYGKAFNRAEREGIIEVDWVPSDEQALRMLMAGRIELFPIVPEVAYSMLRKQFTHEEVEQLTYHPKPLWENSMHLLLSREVSENRQRIQAFNKGLRYLKDNGLIARFLQESRRGEYAHANLR